MKKITKFFATILTIIMVLAPTTQVFAATTTPTTPSKTEIEQMTKQTLTPIIIKDPKTGAEIEKITIPMTIQDPKTGTVKGNGSMSASEESWTDFYVSGSSIRWVIHQPGADDFAGTLGLTCLNHGWVSMPQAIHGLTGSLPFNLVKGWQYQVVLTGYSTPDNSVIFGAGQFTY